YQSILAVLKHPYTRQLSTTAKDLEKTIIDKNMFYLYPSQIKQDDFLEQLFSPQLTTTDFCKYLIQIIELCTPLYRKDEKEENVFDQLYRESLFKAYTLINRIYGLIDS